MRSSVCEPQAARAGRAPLLRRLLAGLLVAGSLAGEPVRGEPPAAPTLEQLEQRVDELYATGRLLYAIPVAEELLAATERRFGPEHENTALRLADLAGLYHAVEKYELAQPLLVRSIAIYERRLGPRHADTATVVNSLAALHRDAGRTAEAEKLHLAVLAIFEETLGADDPQTAAARELLAVLYARTGRQDQAEPLLVRALAAKRRSLGPNHPDTAASAANLGALYHLLGQYGKAEKLLGEALTIREQALGASHPDTVTNVYNLAAAYRELGALGRAAALFERALRGYDGIYGSGHSLALNCMASLAALYREMGAYDKAEGLYRLLLQIREAKLGQHPDTADTLAELGAVYRLAGAYDKADAMLRRALELRERLQGADHPATAKTAESLGLVYLDAESYARAETLLRRALAIHETALGADHVDTAISRANLAGLRVRMGDFDEAEALYLKALPAIERTRGDEHLATAAILHNLGVLYTEIGAVNSAEAPLRRALEIRRSKLGPDHPLTAESLESLAGLHWRQARWAEAADEFNQAAAGEEAQTRRMLLAGDETRKLAYAELGRFRAHKRINFAIDAHAKLPAADAIGLLAVLREKGRVLGLMAQVLTEVRRWDLPPERKLLQRLRETNDEYAALTLAAGSETPNPERRAHVARLRAQIESIEAELSEGLVESRQPGGAIGIEAVQRAIAPNAALVEFFRYRRMDIGAKGRHAAWGAPRYVAYVLRREGAPGAVDLGDAAALERDIADLLAALRDPSRVWFRQAARQLERSLIAPLRGAIGPATHVMVSPDGQLNRLPFGALLGSDGRYLTERWQITYLTSGRDLLEPAKARPARGLPIVMAAPDFGPAADPAVEGSAQAPDPPPAGNRRPAELRVGTLKFAPLPGTASEAQALQLILGLPPHQVLTGADATEAALKGVAGPRVLHIATHGYFLPDRIEPDGSLPRRPGTDKARDASANENPLLRAGLAFAGANQLRSGKDDGVLTALEAAGLDLAGTELAVLSACETGLGDVRNGEGVFGLRRALTLAGVRTQVASLWKVDDAATRDLMVDFYRRLQAGAGKSQALREAQLAMLKDGRRNHPYYWAGFVAIGDAGPMTRP